MRQSNTCPLKKSGFCITFAKNSPAKKFRRLEISAPSNNDIPNAAKQKAKGPYKCVCGKAPSNIRRAVGNEDFKNVSKNFKIFGSFFDGNRPNKTLVTSSQHVTQLKKFHQLVQHY